MRKKIWFEDVQLCTTLRESPGARTLYSPSFAAISGENFTNTPVNEGLPPFAWTMVNLSTGKVEANVRGSSSSFTVSLPVLVIVASTLKLSTPPTLLGPRGPTNVKLSCVRHNVGHTGQGDGQGRQCIDCSRCEEMRSEKSLENHVVWGTRCRNTMSVNLFISKNCRKPIQVFSSKSS